jgi:hypothetical protein
MPERGKTRGGRDADSALEMALSRYFAEELESERKVTPPAPVERLPPASSEARRFAKPAPSWGRAVLSNIGFAACFLIISSATFTYRESHPGALSRRFAQAYADGSLSANAEYVSGGVRRAFESYLSRREPAKEGPRLFNRFR